MTKRSSAPARALAAIAVIGGFVLVVAVFASTLGGDDSGDSGSRTSTGSTVHESKKPAKKTPATYVIKSGDTLTAIAHSTGVSIVQIQELNPGVDPQILIAGEKLKLR